MLSVPKVMYDMQGKRWRCLDIHYEVYQSLGRKDLRKTFYMTLFSCESKSSNKKEGVRLKVRDQIEKRRPIFVMRRLNLNKLVRTRTKRDMHTRETWSGVKEMFYYSTLGIKGSTRSVSKSTDYMNSSWLFYSHWLTPTGLGRSDN